LVATQQTRAYLDTVVGEWSDPLQSLRYDFFSVIARVVHHVHAGMPAKLTEVFPKQYRKKLFLFCSKYCGHAPKALTDKESPDANQLIKVPCVCRVSSCVVCIVDILHHAFAVRGR
jgi:hypothetical protein